MDPMVSLSSHANVWETCLQLLERRGYRLTVRGPEPHELHARYTAQRDGFTFHADNPIELVGLVTVYDDVQPPASVAYWWTAKTTRAEVYQRLQREADTRQDAVHAALEAMRARDPGAWEARVRQALDEGGDEINAATFLDVTRAELVRLLDDPRLGDLRARLKTPIR